MYLWFTMHLVYSLKDLSWNPGVIIKASPLWQFLNYIFSFLLCKAVEQLALPSSSFLSSFLLSYPLQFKYSICISRENWQSFWINSLYFQSQQDFGSLPFLAALVSLNSICFSNPVILPKTVLASFLLAEDNILGVG